MHRSLSHQATLSLPLSTSPLATVDHMYLQQQWTRHWIELTLQQALPITNLFLCLRTGVILCKLMNKLQSGAVPHIHYNECLSAKEENIRQFLKAGSKMGLHDSELFYVDDLLQGKNMNAVIWTLFRLAVLVNTKNSMSWSSYDLHSMDSPVLSSTPPPFVSDNSNYHHHHHHHANQPKAINKRNRMGLKGSNDNDTSSSSSFNQQKRGQDSQGIKSNNQLRYSLSSLSGEEDLFLNDLDPSPPTNNNSLYQMSRSIKTFSSDSGYGTTRQSSWDQQSDDDQSMPIPLASLFDRPVSQGTNDETTKNNKESSRLSSLSLSKTFSLAQKTPFHMQYQEWTEAHPTSNHNNMKPSVIDLFPPTDLPLPIVQSSVSSPLLSKHNNTQSKRRRRSILTINRTTQKRATPSTTTTTKTHKQLDVTNGTSHVEYITRRKSTGNLTHSTITQTSSDLVYEDINLELIDDEGQVTGNYKLGNVIGKGQFGIVYRALELGSGRMVAVKRIKLHSSKKRDMVDVMQEAQLLQRLGHPNIVKYEGFIQAEGHVNIILEYVENGSLLNTLKSFGSFPENLVAGYCTRILQGLEYLHDQNVVHCDLKAANLLTTKSGHVKLSDFGVSLNLGLKETEVGNVAGTPNWMAPEVIELKGASTKSDIWSLGCTIIELCTGKPPYADLLPMTALFRIVEDDYPPIPNGLSQDLCDFLQQCFAKNPNDRPTATDLLTHSWICKYHQQHNDESSFGNVVMDISTSAGIETAPHTPLDLEETDNDFPPWLLPKHHSRSPSVLAAKFQQQKQQQTHRYVKGTFSKGAVKCKSCQLPIKKNAYICEDCGFICHDQCKTETQCYRSTTTHGQPSPTPTLSYTQEEGHQKKRRPTSSYSIQALLSTSSSSLSVLSSPQQRYQQRRQSSIVESPKPRASVSTQLRQHTRKLSRVFSSKQDPCLHHAYKSNESLRLIKEENSITPPPPSSNRRDKLKRRTNHPDDCIIS